MHSQYLDDIKRYSAAPNENAVAGIVKHLGIALKSADASLVSCSSKDELNRVREKWLKKKLALTEDDATLDNTIANICATMHGDTRKNRVTYYYLLAEKYGKLAALGG